MYARLKILLFGAAALFLLVPGCKEKEKADQTEILSADTTVTIAFVAGKGVWRQQKLMRAGAEKAAEELGRVELFWQAPSAGTGISSQKALILELDTAKIKGVILDPVDNVALVKPVRQIEQAGIPVVIIDSDLEGDDYSARIAHDDSAAGALAARELAKLTGGQGNLIVLRHLEDDRPPRQGNRFSCIPLRKNLPEFPSCPTTSMRARPQKAHWSGRKTS